MVSGTGVADVAPRPDTLEESRAEVKTRPYMNPYVAGVGLGVFHGNLERFAAEHGVDLAASFFYTDSVSDLPLLERVGQPVAVNPDPRLRRLARRRGWPIESFY